MFDPESGARIIEENSDLGTQHVKIFNVSYPPLFPKIPLKNVVVDNLHIFLRVADILIDLLIGELRVLDRVSKSTRRKS